MLALAGTLALFALYHAVDQALFGEEEAGPAKPPPVFVPDINRSPAHHLLLLPQVGPARADAIVSERERGGPFADLDDLQRVRGIGPATVAGLRGLATAGGP